MKSFRNIYKSALWIAALLVVALAGCTDEIEYPDDEGAGRPVTLSVNVRLPEMTPISRSDMAAGLDGRVESLWIGVYSASSQQRTGVYSETGLNASPTHDYPESVKINAETGRSYIVAVANFEGRSAHNGTEVVSLEQALSDADTWEKFNNLSTMFDTDGDINADVPLNVLLMSGHYIDGTHANGDHTQIEAVTIPATGELPGAIHLRRTISQVRFNVTYNADNIEDFEVVGWTVHNVPNQSWLYEHTAGTLNAGDLRTVGTKGSYQHTPTTNVVTHNGNTYSFDWWQVENKRTGLEPPESHNKNGDYYSYREEEFKTDAGLNTGKYKSLVTAVDAEDLSNNNATFVELRVRMSLKVKENGQPLVDENGQPISSRVVDGVYTVHLGYCEGSGKSKAQDFNCRRNSKYTYDVTINNVNDILVEARKEGEPTPGGEGMVSDVTEKYVELDAHYGVYNIYLSDEDLYPTIANRSFDYMIRCYDENNQPVDIDSRVPSSVTAADSKYINWVEIRRTTDAYTLAPYKPRTGANADSDNPTMTIQEFWEKVSAGNENKDARPIKAGHYTVFFNEYVYETATDGDEEGSTAWHDYVNKHNRTVWIRVLVDQSTDGESSYYNSKYAFSQRSIQTYYNTNAETENALGVEHVNESYGLNLRNSFYNSIDSRFFLPVLDDLDKNNGRFNVAMYLVGRQSRNFTSGFSWNNDLLWSDVVKSNKSQLINAIQNIQGVNKDEVTQDNPHSVPAVVEINKDAAIYNPTIAGVSNRYKADESFDPDQSANARYIEAVTACMNRNRDLDGDGRIDADELRWYVPTANQYIRVILGRRSLNTPLMDYDANPKLQSPTGSYTDNGFVTSLMLYGSDGRDVWAMEGTSISSWREYHDGAAWNVRCVRNLGSNLNTIDDTEKVKPAYRRRTASSDIIEMIYYDAKSVRQEKLTQMLPHDIANQDYNRVYKAFQYSNLIDMNYMNGSTQYYYDWATWLRNVNPCENIKDKNGNNILQGSGWRIPNQKEITIMNTLNVRPTKNFTISATFAHYNKNGIALTSQGDLNSVDYKIMCTNKDGKSTQTGFDEIVKSVQFRCVRDVD